MPGGISRDPVAQDHRSTQHPRSRVRPDRSQASLSDCETRHAKPDRGIGTHSSPDLKKGILMPRTLLPESQIHPAVREKIASYRTDILKEVQAAVAANAIVVVGMRQNPFPKKARKALDAAGIAYKYLEYGSYLGEWRRRLALKMWTGWPTFPMVFVKGVLIGGASDLAKLIESGELGKKR